MLENIANIEDECAGARNQERLSQAHFGDEFRSDAEGENGESQKLERASDESLVHGIGRTDRQVGHPFSDAGAVRQRCFALESR
jgi:hypothetical protein